jgi:hypothetical protein
MFSRVANRPVSIRELNEMYYQMAQSAEAPKCIKELVWDLDGEYPRCRELEDVAAFIMALHKFPSHRI